MYGKMMLPVVSSTQVEPNSSQHSNIKDPNIVSQNESNPLHRQLLHKSSQFVDGT